MTKKKDVVKGSKDSGEVSEEENAKQVKLEGVVKKIKAVLEEERAVIMPILRFSENGITPDLVPALLPDEKEDEEEEVKEDSSNEEDTDK